MNNSSLIRRREVWGIALAKSLSDLRTRQHGSRPKPRLWPADTSPYPKKRRRRLFPMNQHSWDEFVTGGDESGIRVLWGLGVLK